MDGHLCIFYMYSSIAMRSSAFVDLSIRQANINKQSYDGATERTAAAAPFINPKWMNQPFGHLTSLFNKRKESSKEKPKSKIDSNQANRYSSSHQARSPLRAREPRRVEKTVTSGDLAAAGVVYWSSSLQLSSSRFVSTMLYVQVHRMFASLLQLFSCILETVDLSGKQPRWRWSK